MVKTTFKPHHPFSWKRHIELTEIKKQFRTKRCKDLDSVQPKLKPKERRQT